MQRAASLVRFGSALAVVVLLVGCTKGGQFDPTEMFNSDVFNSKKKLQGQREPLFPGGVPGTETGVPPDQAAAGGGATPDTAAAAEAKPKPKPKPQPKLARAPAQPQRPASQAPTRISIGVAPKSSAPAQQSSEASQAVWPAPPQGVPAQQTTQSSQSVWPAPPQTAPGQQATQPAQSIWPNPPAPGTFSR